MTAAATTAESELLGRTPDEIDTPYLCLDLDVMEANIRAIAAACKQHNVAWRPHAKGHKNSLIARTQVAAGAIGATCAKLGEAEVLAAAGVRDLLIANMIVGPHKVRRLVELRKIADPIVAVDSFAQVEPIAQAMHAAGLRCRVIIEIDVGLARVGTLPGEPTLQLARQIAAQPGVELAGIMGYEGHLLTLQDQKEKRQKIHAALEVLVQTKKQLEAAGLPCPIVSCAGSGSYQISITHPGITEVQAGGAIFMDAFYRDMCHVADLQYALTVPTTIVSRSAPDRAIIDAGRKTLNIEVAKPQIRGRTDVRVRSLSAEHGTLELDPSAQDLKIGDRLHLIPGYEDLTVALHDRFYCFRNNRLVEIRKIEARGLVQ